MKGLLTFVGLFVFLALYKPVKNVHAECGGFISATSSGIISTPNYPDDYGNGMLCIWLLEAPQDYYVKLTFSELSLEGSTQDGCLDELEIRDGSSTSSVLFYGCNVSTSTTVSSTSRWMWIYTKSNDVITARGFSATWLSEVGGVTDKASPIAECPWTHFECENKECVSWSSVCDKWPDCGCYSGCDEDQCGGLNYDYTIILAIGIGSGGSMFVIIVVIIVSWDTYQKKKAKRKEEERQKEAIAMKRKQDNMKAVKLTAGAIISSRQDVKVSTDATKTKETSAAVK